MTTTLREEAAPEVEAPTEAAAASRFAHQPALDGLRGLAVAAVLLFHGDHLTGGYLGVDAFFVLSGFLITSLLLIETRNAGRVSLGAFWARRARRLVPALAGVLLGVAIYALVFAQPEELSNIRSDALATLGYVANWKQIFASNDYFEQFHDPSPLRHTWSLAIEEQFYLLWPLVVVGLLFLRRGANVARPVLAVSIVLAVASIGFGLAIYDSAGANRVYFGTDTRLASIAIGAALAAALVVRGPIKRPSVRRALEIAAWIAVAGLAVAWTRLDGSSDVLYRGALAACAIAVAIVITAAVHPERGSVHRALSWRPLCWLGLISYGLYLWHWPLYVFLDEERTHLTGWPLLLVRIAATLLIATASYFWLEKPIRRGALRANAARAVVPVVLAALVGVTLFATADGGADSSGPAPKHGGILLVGNSVASTLGPGFARKGVPIANRSVVGCSLLRGLTAPRNRWGLSCGPFATWAAEQRPEFAILITGVYETRDVQPDGTGPALRPGDDAYAAYFRNALQHAIDDLSSTGAKVVVPVVPCMDGEAMPEDLQEQAGVNNARRAVENGLIREVASRAANRARVTVPDLDAFLCPHGTYTRRVGLVSAVRGDGQHFTREGADLVAEWFLREVPGLRNAGGRTRLNEGDRISQILIARGWICSTYAQSDPTKGTYHRVSKAMCRIPRRPRTILATYQTVKGVNVAVGETLKFECTQPPENRSAEIIRGDLWMITADAPVDGATVRALGGTRVAIRC